jgi:hypothetical protein
VPGAGALISHRPLCGKRRLVTPASTGSPVKTQVKKIDGLSIRYAERMALFTAGTRYIVFRDATAAEPTQQLNRRESLAPVFDDLNTYLWDG